MNGRWSSLLCILALTSGCRSTPGASDSASASANKPEAPTAQKDSHPASGFLVNYSQLKPASDREGVALYIDRSADYRPYTKVMFDPTLLYITPNPDYPELPHDELARMADGLQQSFRQVLAPDYQVVSTHGPDVLRVRTAITGIQPAKPSAGFTDYLPIKAIVNVGREMGGSAPRVAEMAVEIEVLDPSGRRVAAATATRKGDQHLPQGAQVTWKDLQSIDAYWAKSFRQRLDELRGVPHQG